MRSPSRSPEPQWRGADEETRRERPYDNGFRRRSGDRRRSRSPARIDRYQPDRDSFRRPRNGGRPVSPTNGQMIDRYVPEQGGPRENPVASPHNMESQVSFTYFAEWWRQEEIFKGEQEFQKTGKRRRDDRGRSDQEIREDRDKEKAEIQKAYDEYKEKLQMRLGRLFVQAHKSEEWFKDRYDPELRDPFKDRLREIRTEVWNNWYADLENGVFDEFSLEGIYRQDSDGKGGMVEKEEGEAVGAAAELNVGDLVPIKGGDLRDSEIDQPTLLIKTIAPTVSRASLEEFCEEYLGRAEAGFRWLSISDPNPVKRFHRIGWILLTPGDADPIGEDQNGDDEKEEKKESEDAEIKDADMNGEKITSVMRALEKINGQTVKNEARGDFVCHVGTHTIRSDFRKKALWDLFSAPERVQRDLELCLQIAEKKEQEQGVPFSGLEKIGERIDYLRENGRLQPPTVPATPRKIKAEADGNMDVDDGEGQIEQEEDGEAGLDEVDDEQLLATKKKLDIVVEYLRRVYNFCLFCVVECDSVHDLLRKCPGGHLRRPRASLSSAALATAKASILGDDFPDLSPQVEEIKEEAPEDGEMPDSPSVVKTPRRGGNRSKAEIQLLRGFNWVKNYEQKLQMLIDPASVDLTKLGGKPLDQALEDALKKYVKQEDEQKFRCKVPECTKLFKGEAFWRKHVEKRHVEWFDAQKKDLELVNAYVLDPCHVVPPRPEANGTGQFPSLNSALPYSTTSSRNFSGIHGMPSFNPMTAMNPMMSMPGAPFFGGFPMAMGAGRFNPQQSAMMGAMGRSGMGPIRRDPRTNGLRIQRGPYDRPVPPRRSGGPNANRWGEGGGGMMGPREAVVGRSLKSYEDLDAVDQGGKASSELNY